MAHKCEACGTGGRFGNSVWKCPLCDKTLCLKCMEKGGQRRGGFLGFGESFTCPKCGGEMRKVAW